MIRIAVVDDEMHVLERFERMVLKIKELELCGLFETGEELLSYLEQNPLDAVFLDIEMPGVNGLQLSERILDMSEFIDIIFVTAFNQYAVEAFEVQAMDYILKPLTPERLLKTVKRLLKTKSTAVRPQKTFIQCFGDFEVFLNGEALVWKNSKAKEVLAFLIHKRGISVNCEKIADAVWPDYDSKKAQTNFHATTYLLCKRLAEGVGLVISAAVTGVATGIVTVGGAMAAPALGALAFSTASGLAVTAAGVGIQIAIGAIVTVAVTGVAGAATLGTGLLVK
ncbi:response regulator [Clostridium sp.]|uniref:response regulator n=1 Tax=Clostridium sp. TaxID=1506 RepID=UPI0025C46F97|nr:response regulator [Clostridium sp.]